MHCPDFLAIYRNIFESGEVPGGITNDSAVNEYDPLVVSASLWTADNVDEMYLESDGEALEYLARHDFDGEEATAALYQELGFGKGRFLLIKQMTLLYHYLISFYIFTMFVFLVRFCAVPTRHNWLA